MKNITTGIGGAPARATTFPDDAKGRKARPVASGVLDYFPDALVAIAEVSWHGNEQHNPGKPLHWDRSKSGDEADCVIRHFLQRGTRDSDNLRHTAKMAWRALALLQKEIEAEQSQAEQSQSSDARLDEITVQSAMAALQEQRAMQHNICECDICTGKKDCGCIRGTVDCKFHSPVTRDLNPE